MQWCNNLKSDSTKMKDFLKYVAADLLKRFNGDFSDVAVVFPNKRASLFLNTYLVEESTRPMWSPRYLTISELFRNHTQMVTADRISLIFELYKCYHKHIRSDETIDSFYNWGEIMLADFDDIDKNMADADGVFALTRDFGEMDNLDYLTDKQKNELKQYFNDSSVKSRLKDNFNRVYEHLADIYHEYNDVLRAKGSTYEGALYRGVAENVSDINFKYKKYVFVGFNMLQKVEERLFEHLMQQDKALFYWDFDRYYTSPQKGLSLEAGHYIVHNLEKFPNALDRDSDEIYNNLNNGTHPKDIDIISATTENAQARYISQWLDEDKIRCRRKTAVVMCDETMLQSAIHCLPESDGLKVNITTGYPLQQTPAASFVSLLTDLFTDGYDREKDNYLVRYVIPVLNHPYTAQLSHDTHAIISKFREKSTLRASAADIIGGNEFLSVIFARLDYNGGDISVNLTERLSQIIRYVSSHFKDGSPLYAESIFRMYTLLQVLGDTLRSYGDMQINIATYRKLVNQIISTTSIPFHGEPIDGIQIMGVLETRNLDFDNILLLSCNEGKMPKGINDTSFIPYTVRKGFGLTTVDHKVDIYAYYFYRLLQRAKNVSIVYNTSTDGTSKNEMSRFVLQLMVEQNHNFRFLSLDTGVETTLKEPPVIMKTPEINRKLAGISKISPSALNTYLRCRLRYYFKYIADIKEPEQIMSEKEVDYRIFGLLFHKAAELLYADKGVYTVSKLEKMSADVNIHTVVGRAFTEELFDGKPLESIESLNGLQRILYNVICRYVRNLLKADLKRAPFEIIGTEQWVNMDVNVDGKAVTISGIADRIDRKGDVTYIVDYKTGTEHPSTFGSIEDLFERGKNAAYDYYIQTILYSIALNNEGHEKTSPVLLYISKFMEYDTYPVLQINKAPVELKKDCEDANIFMQHITESLTSLFSNETPFTPTPLADECSQCPYYALCYGRELMGD